MRFRDVNVIRPEKVCGRRGTINRSVDFSGQRLTARAHRLPTFTYAEVTFMHGHSASACVGRDEGRGWIVGSCVWAPKSHFAFSPR